MHTEVLKLFYASIKKKVQRDFKLKKKKKMHKLKNYVRRHARQIKKPCSILFRNNLC